MSWDGESWRDPEWIDEDLVEAFEDATCLKASESDSAVLIRWGRDKPERLWHEAESWVPRSVIPHDSQVFDPGERGQLRLRLWWVERGGEE